MNKNLFPFPYYDLHIFLAWRERRCLLCPACYMIMRIRTFALTDFGHGRKRNLRCLDSDLTRSQKLLLIISYSHSLWMLGSETFPCHVFLYSAYYSLYFYWYRFMYQNIPVLTNFPTLLVCFKIFSFLLCLDKL